MFVIRLIVTIRRRLAVRRRFRDERSDYNLIHPTMSDVPTSDSACLLIPPVQGFALGDWEATARVMRTGVRVDFGQTWFPQPEPNFAPGHVWLGVQGDELVAYAVLTDDRPVNRATKLNDPMWMTGDVLELFFHAEGRPAYYEFHVTPENIHLQLFFPSTAAFHEGRGHRHWSLTEPKFTSATRINADRTGWEAVMRVPLALVLDEPRADGARKFRFSFSRYDYQPGRKYPVTSATPRMSRPDFHGMHEWDWAEAARG